MSSILHLSISLRIKKSEKSWRTSITNNTYSNALQVRDINITNNTYSNALQVRDISITNNTDSNALQVRDITTKYNNKGYRLHGKTKMFNIIFFIINHNVIRV